MLTFPSNFQPYTSQMKVICLFSFGTKNVEGSICRPFSYTYGQLGIRNKWNLNSYDSKFHIYWFCFQISMQNNSIGFGCPHVKSKILYARLENTYNGKLKALSSWVNQGLLRKWRQNLKSLITEIKSEMDVVCSCRSGYRAWLEIMWALPAQVRILPSTHASNLSFSLFLFRSYEFAESWHNSFKQIWEYT